MNLHVHLIYLLFQILNGIIVRIRLSLRWLCAFFYVRQGVLRQLFPQHCLKLSVEILLNLQVVVELLLSEVLLEQLLRYVYVFRENLADVF